MNIKERAELQRFIRSFEPEIKIRNGVCYANVKYVPEETRIKIERAEKMISALKI